MMRVMGRTDQSRSCDVWISMGIGMRGTNGVGMTSEEDTWRLVRTVGDIERRGCKRTPVRAI